MVAECDRRYPGLRNEIERVEKDPGVVAYLLNTLIDLQALGYGVHEANPTGSHVHDEEKNESL
jgi:hypothetical protein